ncbi:myelin-associated glycoprotein-like [Mantella aurantiaca]
MSVTRKILLLTVFQGLVPGPLCQRWEFPTKIDGLIGSCVEIPCTYYPPGNSGTSGTVWYLYSLIGFNQIYNSQGSSSVIKYYKERTSLVHGINSCSLRIDPVRRDDDGLYYPGDQETNAWLQSRKSVEVSAKDTLSKPVLIGHRTMLEGQPENVTCSVAHTCGSSPPSLKWNKPGQTERRSMDLSGGNWRETLTLTYIPSQEDDRTQMQCTATYHNGITSQNAATLDITYAPRNVTVSLSENKEFLEGNNVILACSSRSNPPPLRYEWFRGKSKMKLEHQNQHITVQNVSRDTDSFSCAAINAVGRGESPPAKIPVLYVPTGVQVIVLHPTEGATELKCSFARSNPDVTRYTWIKDGNWTMNTTGPILVLGGKEDESGSYACIAHNAAGSSASAELDFKDSKDPAGNEDSPNLLLILGISAGVILLVMIVFFYTRIKVCQTSSKPENSEQPEATYTDLVKAEVQSDYDTLKTLSPAQPAAAQRDLTSDNHYENL